MVSHTVVPGTIAVTGCIDAAGLGPDTSSALLIPSTAVFADPSGQSSVWVVDPESQRVALWPVELGAWHNDSIEVLDGLQAGETIVISAVQMLQTGMKVEQMRDLGEL